MKKIYLTMGYFAIVDDEDYDWLMQWKWQFSHGYAKRSGYLGVIDGKYKKINIMMHREINKTPKGLFTDHIDNNKLNNQKDNLRNSTKSQNGMNVAKKHKNTTGKFKGAYWDKRRNKWASAINLNRKFIFLGYFDNEIDAAKSYDRAALKYHGEFAFLNFNRQ